MSSAPRTARIARLPARSARTGLLQVRKATTDANGEFLGKDLIIEKRKAQSHATGSGDLWRKITYYVAFPIITALAVNTWNLEQAHKAHMQHIIEENGGEKPERVVYDYMNVRHRSFPWGNQSLFFSEEHNIKVED